jgi:hypothetical protein
MSDENRIDPRDGGFPPIGQPALRALRVAGVTRLDQLTGWRRSDAAALHGMGPKGLRLLGDALSAAGLSCRAP